MRCNRGSAAIYLVFSMLLLSSLFLLFTSYASSTSTLTREAQEQFHTTLLAGRISNLIDIAQYQHTASETTPTGRFFLYGIKPTNYTIETGNNTLLLKSGSAEAAIRTGGAKISVEERGPSKLLKVEPQ